MNPFYMIQSKPGNAEKEKKKKNSSMYVCMWQEVATSMQTPDAHSQMHRLRVACTSIFYHQKLNPIQSNFVLMAIVLLNAVPGVQDLQKLD
jgi:hypothetical protein